MSTVRIQIRRGTASEWTSVDPILAAGEMGLESDTNYIKFGNGTDVWSDLPYAGDNLSQLQSSLDNSYVQIADLGQPNGAASLDSSGKIPAGQLNISELAQDAISNALVAGSNTDIAYNDAANQITIGVTDSIVLAGDLTVSGDSTVEALTINGNLTVNGTTTTVSATDVVIEDPMIYIGDGNSSNSLDLGVVGAFNNGTYQHTGLVRDASDGVWKLFSGVIPEPTTTVDFTTHTKDALEVGSFSATNAVIGNVSNNEIQYLDGVTSAIQTQLNAKLASSTASSTYAPIASPTFTGTVVLPSTTSIGNLSATELGYVDGVTSAIQTQIDDKAPKYSPTFTGVVSGITKSMVGLSNVDNTADTAKPVSTEQQTALNLKADLISPTFTGTVVLPGTTSIGTVSAIEISYLDGVTSSVQTQIGSTNTTLSNHSSATTSVHGIADTAALATKTYVDNAGATLQTNINAKAPTASPTFTGTVSGITKSMVGLANVDNTSDVAKPVSSATQTALDLKANLNSPTFTGTVVLPSTTSIGNVSAAEIGYVDGVTSAIQTQIDSKLGLAGGTMTGALTLSGAPTADLHAATKAYVDNISAGLNFHQPVRVATTTNITLSGTQTIDGVSLSIGDRVLVKDQTTQTQNGIYVVASGAWTRSTDADNNPAGELAGGDFCLVLEGVVGAGYGYVCSNTSAITLGTTSVTYTPFNAAKAITAGSGLIESTPGTLDIATGGVTSAMIADGTIIDQDISASAAIAQSKILGLSTSLGLKANLASPSFTGGVTVDSSGVIFTDGTQQKQGVPSITPIISKTASYALSSLTERDSMIEVNSASATTITIPTNASVAFPIGASIDISQISTGQVTIAGAGGVTVNATPGLKLRTQWSTATLFKRGTDSWIVYGDLTA